jgi:hypothetical protein
MLAGAFDLRRSSPAPGLSTGAPGIISAVIVGKIPSA